MNSTRILAALLPMVLPLAARAEDTSVQVKCDICAEIDGGYFARTPFEIVAGPDVSGIELNFEIGNFVIAPEDHAQYVGEGTLFPAMTFDFMQSMVFPNESVSYGSHRWTYVMKVFDMRERPCSVLTATVFAPELPEDWEDYAEGRFTDLFFASERETGETCTVKVQRNRKQHGRLRLVNPYASNPGIADSDRPSRCKAHDHYIYINAEDPEFVYIEESTAGLDFGEGEAIFTSTVGAKLNTRTVADLENYTINVPARIAAMKASGMTAGRLEEGRVVFPAGVLGYGETGHGGLAFQEGGEGCLLVLDLSSVDEVSLNGDAGVEYYNMDGTRVGNPEVPGLYIMRRGAESRKIIIR